MGARGVLEGFGCGGRKDGWHYCGDIAEMRGEYGLGHIYGGKWQFVVIEGGRTEGVWTLMCTLYVSKEVSRCKTRRRDRRRYSGCLSVMSYPCSHFVFSVCLVRFYVMIMFMGLLDVYLIIPP